jgi:hypothetical protein
MVTTGEDACVLVDLRVELGIGCCRGARWVWDPWQQEAIVEGVHIGAGGRVHRGRAVNMRLVTVMGDGEKSARKGVAGPIST